jgi:tRNA A-37 threonylcarbamoyl transferase component Bud32
LRRSMSSLVLTASPPPPLPGPETGATIAGLEPVAVLASSRTTDTSVVELPALGRVIRKRWRWPTAGDRLRGTFRTTFGAASPAVREFHALERLAGLPSGAFGPRPLAAFEERTAGVLASCTLLLEEVADALDLARFLASERSPLLRRAVLTDLARRLGGMHAAGLVDRDFHPRNVLVVAAAGRTWKIDCPKQTRRSGALGPGAASVDLGALDVGLVRLSSARERARFFARYAAGRDRAAKRDLCARARRVRERIDVRESRRLP